MRCGPRHGSRTRRAEAGLLSHPHPGEWEAATLWPARPAGSLGLSRGRPDRAGPSLLCENERVAGGGLRALSPGISATPPTLDATLGLGPVTKTWLCPLRRGPGPHGHVQNHTCCPRQTFNLNVPAGPPAQRAVPGGSAPVKRRLLSRTCFLCS